MKIDIYNHVMPMAYLELMKRHSADAGMVKRISSVRLVWDIEARVQMLERFPDVQQVLTLSQPAPEMLGGPDLAVEAARVANDGMAEICRKWPHKFPAFVAALPMNDVPAAIVEMDRSIGTLGAKGIQIGTSVNGRPLDDSELFPIFERITNHHDLPIWMHPFRPATAADYRTENKSRYEIWQVLGWPFETSVAMARIVFSGMLDRLPTMRIVTHHCGGVVPYLAGRADTLWAQLGSRTADEDYSAVLKRMSKPPIEYFKMFFGDTVLGGSAPALRCGLDFFDPEGGPMFIREGIRSIEDLDLPDAIKEKIYYANAARLLKMRPA
jgi:aminocarboxymuconate-semialdehyde decarboxylase